MTLPAAVPREGGEEIPGSSFVGDKQIAVEAEEEIAVAAKLFEFGAPGFQTPRPSPSPSPHAGRGLLAPPYLVLHLLIAALRLGLNGLFSSSNFATSTGALYITISRTKLI